MVRGCAPKDPKPMINDVQGSSVKSRLLYRRMNIIAHLRWLCAHTSKIISLSVRV